MIDSGNFMTGVRGIGRGISEDVLQQSAYFSSNDLLCQLTEAISVGIMVLNQNQEIVYTNQEFLNQIQLLKGDVLLGRHFGNVVNCVHAFETEEGCGTAVPCKSCNIFFSVMQAQRGKRNTQEGQIIRRIEDIEEGLDLRVWSFPLHHENQQFIVVNVLNMADEKRRRTLEDIFFHELANNAGAIQSLLSLYSSLSEDDGSGLNYGDLLSQVSRQLLDDIDAQRQLLSAERGDLSVVPMQVYSLAYLAEIMDSFEHYFLAGVRRLRLAPEAFDVRFVSDRAILGRVLRYMVKNGLGGAADGEVVTVGCDEQDGRVRFWVHFPAYLPPEDQAQVFQRQVSIHGIGRGVETYSMKLLSERYLQGEIAFESDPEAGSKFIAQYPKELAVEMK